MSIRHKLALIFSAVVAVTAAAAVAVFLLIQDVSLRAVEREKTLLLMQSVRAMASEAQLARDPLMLLDYLGFLCRDRPEIVSARVRFGESWQEVGGGRKESPGDVNPVESIVVPADSGRPAAAVEVRFAGRVLDRRLSAARAAVARDLGRTVVLVLLAGVLLSFPVGRMVTRRLLAIESALAEVSAGRLKRRLEVSGADEIARLGKGVNAMMDRLLELEDMKRTFIASVTHELRSPLFAIQSYVRLLLSDAKALSEEDRRQLDRVSENAGRLAHFVTSLLNTAKIERGSMDFVPRMSDLPRLVDDVVMFHRARAEEEGKSLSTSIADGIPRLALDPDLIAQVVTNLLSNAIKFTPRGGRVTVALRRAADAVECSVADTGVGIPAAALPRLFIPFERVKNSVSTIGAGLGLSIVKALVEMHGGAVGVESAPGRGSRFFFSLPIDNKSLTAGRRK